jgi:transcriptional regulator with XRE-family HTH domain
LKTQAFTRCQDLQWRIVAASDAVLQRLKQAGVRPKQLVDALGVSSGMATMMLNGKRGISVWHLDALAQLLGVSVPELFLRDEMRAPGKGLSDKKIDESVTQLVHDIGVSSALLVQEPYAQTPRGTSDAEPPAVRSPLVVAEALHAHAAALTELALRIARDAGRAARGRPESPAVGHAHPASLPKRATSGRRHRK